MKFNLQLLFIIVCTIQLQAQVAEDEVYHSQPVELDPCYYTSYTLNSDGEIENLQTESVMVEEWTTPIRGRIIDFTLLKVDQDLILLVEIHIDAQEKLQPICFGSKTTIQFQLQNGEKVTLPQFGLKRCGYVNVADDESPYYNITNLSYFLIPEKAAKQLLASKVNLASLSSTNYELDFVFNSEIYDEVNDIMLYPEFYFISELECMLNPILPKD